jgi:indolepyruvate ferredoxin oxidoreductase
VTVGAVLAMAAHLQGLQASVYDMTGMSQKNGAVLSHLRFAADEAPIRSQTVGLGEASLVVAFDMVAAVSDEAFRTLSADSHFLGNDRVQVTPAFNFNPDERIDTGFLTRKIRARVGADHMALVDATGIALALCGDAIATNFLMVGVALQRGWLPLTLEAVRKAVELNGVQVAFNLDAIRLGRLLAHDPAVVARLLADNGFVPQTPPPMSLDELLADRERRLTDYQNAAYARRFRTLIDRVRAAEDRVAPGQTALTDVAARALHRLMAYKDEYEVARLHADPAFHAAIAAQFEGTPKLKYHLAPPLFARRDPRTGHLVKSTYGSWMLPAFRLLSRFRFLRGSALDPFGRTEERRTERALIGEYERLLEGIVSRLAPHNHAAAVDLAGASLTIRGYGHVKERQLAKAREEQQRLQAAFDAAATAPVPQRVSA